MQLSTIEEQRSGLLEVRDSDMVKKKRNNKGRSPGFVLVLTLFTALIMGTLIMGFALSLAVDFNLVANHMNSLRAYYIAEAGVADAINQMRTSGAMSDSSWSSTFPPSTSDQYSVAVSSISTLITSTGTASASGFSRQLLVRVAVDRQHNARDELRVG